MTQTNKDDAVPFTALEVTELNEAELNAIEGGVWWCGTGQVDIFGRPRPVPHLINIVIGKPVKVG